MKTHVGPAVAAVAILLGSAGPGRPSFRTARGLELSPMHAAAVASALAGAARRLERPECGRILEEFQDEKGAPLRRRVDALGLTGPEYLGLIVFADGSPRRTCHGHDAAAVTAPGSRVVYVCGQWFHDIHRRDPARAEIVVLHEALHTLGLGENPPTSREITRRVAERCGSLLLSP